MVGLTLFAFRVIFSTEARTAMCQCYSKRNPLNEVSEGSLKKHNRPSSNSKNLKAYKLVSNGQMLSPPNERKMNIYTPERPMRSLDISKLDENGQEVKPIIRYNNAPNNKSKSWLHSNYRLLPEKEEFLKERDESDYSHTYIENDWVASTKL